MITTEKRSKTCLLLLLEFLIEFSCRRSHLAQLTSKVPDMCFHVLHAFSMAAALWRSISGVLGFSNFTDPKCFNVFDPKNTSTNNLAVSCPLTLLDVWAQVLHGQVQRICLFLPGSRWQLAKPSITFVPTISLKETRVWPLLLCWLRQCWYGCPPQGRKQLKIKNR